MICQHFINATHELCPEERQQIGDLSLKSAHAFIDEICKQMLFENVCVGLHDTVMITMDNELYKYIYSRLNYVSMFVHSKPTSKLASEPTSKPISKL